MAIERRTVAVMFAASATSVANIHYLSVLAFGNRALARRIGPRHRLSTHVDAGGHGTRDADVRAAGRYVPAPETHRGHVRSPAGIVAHLILPFAAKLARLRRCADGCMPLGKPPQSRRQHRWFKCLKFRYSQEVCAAVPRRRRSYPPPDRKQASVSNNGPSWLNRSWEMPCSDPVQRHSGNYRK
jgi:hypothetical protein